MLRGSTGSNKALDFSLACLFLFLFISLLAFLLLPVVCDLTATSVRKPDGMPVDIGLTVSAAPSFAIGVPLAACVLVVPAMKCYMNTSRVKRVDERREDFTLIARSFLLYWCPNLCWGSCCFHERERARMI